MNQRRYMVDTNVLVRLSSAQRASRLFVEHCRVPSDVVDEVKDSIPPESLRDVEYLVSARVLRALQRVMGSLRPGDTSLVDLYANKGKADPLLVACALDAAAEDGETLFPDVWVIVSDDEAVRRVANRFGFETLGGGAFLALFPSDSKGVEVGAASSRVHSRRRDSV